MGENGESHATNTAVLESRHSTFVDADPYQWPYNGLLKPSNTALVIIDMQVDFCGQGGYVARMGYSVENTRRPIAPIQKVLDLCRCLSLLVIHTREGHRPDLSDLPANKRWRSKQMGAEIGVAEPCGGKILTRGEPGWEIIPELQPIAGEVILDKPGKGAFYATDLDMILRTRGIANLVICGVTTDVCVSTTMREANDRGYECMVLSDCTGAIEEANHQASLDIFKMQGGIFGTVSTSVEFIAGIEKAIQGGIEADG